MLPRLNIVVYTDCHSLFNQNPLSPRGSLSDFRAFTEQKTAGLVDLNFCFVSRHPTDPKTGSEIHAGCRVTSELLADADEFWVFGRRKINNENQPANELDDKEVAVLDKWMSETKKGGVFITGDHSEPDETLPDPKCEKADHKTFLSLGRALGHRIPRANQLRDWKGPPTNCNESFPLETRDNFNTQEGAEPCHLDDPLLESDRTPQTILLSLKECQPHRLFWYTDPEGTFRPIMRLSDHPHEGVTLAPDELNSEWPPHSMPPEIVASGRDKRFPNENRIGGLVTAFDGDSSNVGRIITDSSFHHYLNYNLMGIPARDPLTGLPVPGTNLDQVAQFFGNLAMWLAPKSIRDKIKWDLLLSLARDPNVLETRGHSVRKVGQVARLVLGTSLPPGRQNWLFATSRFEKTDAADEFFSLIFSDESDSAPSFIQPNFLLGLVITVCQAFLSGQHVADVTRFAGSEKLIAVLPERIMGFLSRHETDTKDLLKEVTRGLN